MKETLQWRDSPYFNQQDRDVISILRNEINLYSAQGDIIFIGDFKSKVELKQESLHWEVIRDTDMCGLDPESKQEKPIPFCDNQDTISNTNGNEILETMTECHLIMANGRTTGDLDGNLTYHGVAGTSVIKKLKK